MPNKYDLTQGSVWSKLWEFFVPIAVGGIVQQAYNTVDGIIVGKYCGTEAFAAITGSVSQILNLMVGTFIALTGGAAVYIAQLYGIKDKEKIRKAVSTSMYVCFFMGIIISVLGVFYSEDLLVWLNTPVDTLEDATIYLQFCFAAAFAVMLYNMGASILRASGDSGRPFYYLCACCVTNIVLDYIFVAKFGWGVWGAAFATAFAQVVSFVLVLIRLLATKEDYKLCLSFSNLSVKAIKATLKYGFPSAIQQILYGITNTMVQVELNLLGTTIVAAWSLTSKVDGIYWAIINAAGVSVMNFVGQNYGAGRLDRVKEATKLSLRNFLIFTISICIILAAFGKSILPLFLDDAEVVDIAYKAMLMFLVSYFAWTTIEVYSGVLKGCGDVIVPSILILVGIVGTRVLWIWFAYPLWKTIYMLAAMFGVSWIITAIMMLIRYKKGGWKKKREL